VHVPSFTDWVYVGRSQIDCKIFFSRFPLNFLVNSNGFFPTLSRLLKLAPSNRSQPSSALCPPAVPFSSPIAQSILITHYVENPCASAQQAPVSTKSTVDETNEEAANHRKDVAEKEKGTNMAPSTVLPVNKATAMAAYHTRRCDGWLFEHSTRFIFGRERHTPIVVSGDCLWCCQVARGQVD
jgi:hypothetical protein